MKHFVRLLFSESYKNILGVNPRMFLILLDEVKDVSVIYSSRVK